MESVICQQNLVPFSTFLCGRAILAAGEDFQPVHKAWIAPLPGNTPPSSLFSCRLLLVRLNVTSVMGDQSRVYLPTCRVSGLGAFINLLTMNQNRLILTTMTLCRCDKANFAVLVLMVVPLHELQNPITCFFQGGESLYRLG